MDKIPKRDINLKKRALELHKQNYKTVDIVSTLNISRRSFFGILRRDRDGFSQCDEPGSGRPRVLGKRTEKRLVRRSKIDPFCTAKQLQTEVPEVGAVSDRTIRRYLCRNRLYGRIAAPKPKLTPTHIRKRIDFCRSKKDWTLRDWNRVIFTDESKLEINPRRKQFVRRPINARHLSKYCTETTKFSKSLMVWGAIRGDGYRTLVKCQGTVNSEQYQRILQQELPDLCSDPSMLFQQDGATIHTFMSTLQFLYSKNVSLLHNYPPQSPDLSMIENLWKILKDRKNVRSPQILDELWEVAKEECDRISELTIKRLFRSLQKQMELVLTAKRRSIHA